MRIEPLTDKNIILETIRNKKIYKNLIDDSCPKNPDDFNVINDLFLYLGVYDHDGEYLGLFLLHRHNLILFEIHTALLPNAWGRSLDCAKSVISWVFSNTDCKRLVTSVPDGNTLAFRLAKSAGMDVYGYNPKSFMLEGELLGQTLLGVSKCQH